jgi:hypothetical protein
MIIKLWTAAQTQIETRRLRWTSRNQPPQHRDRPRGPTIGLIRAPATLALSWPRRRRPAIKEQA